MKYLNKITNYTIKKSIEVQLKKHVFFRVFLFWKINDSFNFKKKTHTYV